MYPRRHPSSNASPTPQRGLRQASFAAGFLLGSLIIVLLLGFFSAAAVSPALHRMVCPDADQPSHQCVITVMAAGLLALTSTQVVASVIPFPTVGFLILRGETHRATPVYRLSPSRAPPSA